MNEKILLRRSVAMAGSIDTIHDSTTILHNGEAGRTEINRRVFDDARTCWDSLDRFRRTALRCHRYTYGDQWGDKIKVDGEWITEGEYLRRQGKVPLKNNVIRPLIKSVLGQYRGTPTRPVCTARNRTEQTYGEMMTMALECVYDLNNMDKLDAHSLESFLIHGMTVNKMRYMWLPKEQRHDVYVEQIDYDRFFFDSRASSLDNLTLVGELRDMSINDVVREFAGSDPIKARQIRQYYTQREGMDAMPADTLKRDRSQRIDFYNCEDPNMCRVIEVWRKESREFLHCHDTARGRTYRLDISQYENILATNLARVEEATLQGIAAEDVAIIETTASIDTYWYVRYFTPFGDILAEYENPYAHGDHPYQVEVYPYINQEVHSFVEDVIDQQRYINRLITMIDFIMGSSAKGVLMMPEDAIPDGMTLEDVTNEWVKYNGVILFKNRPGNALPQQISTNATNVGAYELLNLQMKLIQDISGVQGAIQGKSPRAGTSGIQYQQETLNAQNNLIDILSSFRTFREDRDRKIVKLMQQFYQDDFPMNVSGNYNDDSKIYRAEQVRDIVYTLSINEASTSPLFRMVNNDLLLQLFSAGAITIKDLLENGSFPFADKLLQSITKREQEMAQQQQQQAALMQQMAAQQQPGQPPLQ